MTTLEARVKRLEVVAREARGRADPEQRLRAAELRIREGTASPDDYGLCYQDEVELGRMDYVASAPVYLAVVRAGLHVVPWLGLIAYPPDVELPQEMTDYIHLLDTVASTTREERDARARRGKFHAEYFSVDERTKASIARLIIGDQEGLELRRQVWTTQGCQWVLASEVLEAAQHDGLDLDEVVGFFSGNPISMSAGCAELQRVAAAHPEVHHPRDDPPWISYSTLADVIDRSGLTDRWGSPTWSDQVKCGQ